MRVLLKWILKLQAALWFDLSFFRLEPKHEFLWWRCQRICIHPLRLVSWTFSIGLLMYIKTSSFRKRVILPSSFENIWRNFYSVGPLGISKLEQDMAVPEARQRIDCVIAQPPEDSSRTYYRLFIVSIHKSMKIDKLQANSLKWCVM